MTQVIWSAQAQADIGAILRFYEREDLDLRRRVERAIIASPGFLIGFPAVGRRGLRKWPIGKLPLVLLDRVKTGRIEVARIRHMAQNWRQPH